MQRRLDSYKRLCTEFYDLDKPVAPLDALEFYWRHYEAIGGPALEAMCGSGRFLVPFAERGADIDGRGRLAGDAGRVPSQDGGAGSNGAAVPAVSSGARTAATVQVRVIPAGSFALIPSEEQQAALRRLADHLSPDGEFMVEIRTPRPNPDGVWTPPPERRVTRPDGSEIVTTVDASGTQRYDLIRNGEVVESEFERTDEARRGRAEIEAMLKVAGFTSVQSLRGYTETAAADGDRDIVCICTRGA